MTRVRKFILVDDDAFNNKISAIAIKRVFGETDTRVFEVPEEGLAFIEKEYTKNPVPAILFLDINMPTLTGWEFLEEYEKFSDEIKKNISVYILSSSVDQRDIDKAKENKYIKGFVSKPLRTESVRSVMEI